MLLAAKSSKAVRFDVEQISVEAKFAPCPSREHPGT
jgi:hypothetical protein